MNRIEAKRLLAVLRSNGADDADPQFAEALHCAQQDPELARQLEEQRRFDRVFARSLKSLAAPRDLKAGILSGRPVLRPAFRRPFWQDWRVGVGVAASLLLLAAVAGFMSARTPVRFADLRKGLVEESWGGEAHLDFKSADLGQIQRWLAGQGVATDLSLPAGLREMRLHGCQMVQANGHRVPMLCLADGSKHLHLFIVSGEQFAGLPSDGKPDFEKYGSWKTAAWREGSMTYILSGLKTQAFVSKFRKFGRWTMSG